MQNNKLYNEWRQLKKRNVNETPVKRKSTTSRRQVAAERKKLKMAGEAYVTAKGNTVTAKGDMKFAECKCVNKCVEVFSLEERKEINYRYRSIRA